MKTDINLLPPAQLKKRTHLIYGRRVNFLYRSFVFGLTVVLVAYGGIGWYRYQQHQALQEQAAAASVTDESVRDEVLVINRFMGEIERRVGMRYFWTERISSALSALPSSMIVRQVNLRDDPERLVIEGSSDSRAGVVSYEEALSDLSWVKSVEAPLRNFAGGSSIEYSMTIFRSEDADL